jgi:hypothetical protein
MHQQQTSELRSAAALFSQAHAEAITVQVEEKSALLIHWLQYLSSFHRTEVADDLLNAATCSVREVAGLLSLGLARPALFSLRGQIDLLLAWLYFKDHSVEWSHVNETAEGFRLRKELLQYLDQYVPKFAMRIGSLREIKTRTESDPYRLLSAHIHAQSAVVLPVVSDLKDLVRNKNVCLECTQACFEVSEYMNDILLCLYLTDWAALPGPVQSALELRFKSADQRQVFFN